MPYIYIKLSTENETEKCLTALLKEIQKHTQYENFFDFIRNNYTAIVDISKGIVTNITKDKYQTIEYFWGLLLDTTQMFIDNKKRRVSPMQLLELYLKSLLTKNKILLIIDNFSYCDNNLLNALKQVHYKYIYNEQLKCIFVKTQEVLEENEPV